MFDNVKLKQVPPMILVEAIYNKLIKRWSNYGNQVTPRWLADFMIKLGNVNDESVLVDMSSSCGVILRNMLENYPDTEYISISSNKENGIWTELISHILNGSPRRIGVYDITKQDI